MEGALCQASGSPATFRGSPKPEAEAGGPRRGSPAYRRSRTHWRGRGRGSSTSPSLLPRTCLYGLGKTPRGMFHGLRAIPHAETRSLPGFTSPKPPTSSSAWEPRSGSPRPCPLSRSPRGASPGTAPGAAQACCPFASWPLWRLCAPRPRPPPHPTP